MADGSRFSVEDPRFREERKASPALPEPIWPKPAEPKKRRTPLASCLVGCLITIVILGVVVAIGVWWVSQNWRGVASALSSEAIKSAINATDLPQQEKNQISLEIDRLAVDFREGRITPNQLRAIFENIKRSPLMTTLAASAIERKYIANSGLEPAEKAEGVQTLRRFLRGLVDGKIDDDGVDDAMQHVAVRTKDGDWRLRDQVSDEQLRSFFTAAERAADEAEVPAEAEDLDPSDEFNRIVDEAMQQP
jgi:hypothetical protein